MAKKIDLAGQKFGRLSIIREVSRPAGLVNTRAYWLCQCECGNQSVSDSGNLRYGQTISCGCAKLDMLQATMVKHGHSRTGKLSSEYRSYQAMLTRCRNSSQKSWKNYGGRGIIVCERWMVFGNFIADMGPKLHPSLTIERDDVNGNYEPGNCRWATVKQQANNHRNNRRVQWTGGLNTIGELSGILRIPYHPLYDHIVRRKKTVESVIALFRGNRR